MQKTMFEKVRDEAIEQGIEKGIEKGIQKGIEKGIEKGTHLAECNWLTTLLEEKFGTISERARKKIEQMSSQERLNVAKRLLSVDRLKDLGL